MGGPSRTALYGPVEFLHNAKQHQLLPEISAVQFLIQERLIEFHEVREWELLVQQFKADGLIGELPAEAPDGDIDDLFMVEGKPGQLPDIVPRYVSLWIDRSTEDTLPLKLSHTKLMRRFYYPKGLMTG